MKEKEIIDKYDIVIVGGGPAGVACGIELQKKGISNCIIDKATFPREKLCGGLLTEKTYKLLSEICNGVDVFSSTIKGECSDISVYSTYKKKTSVTANTKVHISERKELDNCLIEYYKSLGGTVYEGEEVIGTIYYNYDEDLNAVKVSINEFEKTVETPNYIFKCKRIVSAEGVHSRLAYNAAYKLESKGFCLEVKIPKSELNISDKEIHIFLNVLDNGYAWVFPCGDHYKVGFGNEFDRSIRYREKFKEYLRGLGISDVESYNPKGAYVPYGELLKKKKTSIIFIGDAGGYVDAIYGEGLYMAYYTGQQAAKSIIENIELADKLFTKKVSWLKKEIKDGRKIRNFILNGRRKEFFIKQLEKNKDFFRYYIDKQISKYSYTYKDILKVWVIYNYYKNKKNK